MNRQERAAMKMLDDFTTAAEVLTGAKAQLVGQGWSEHAAEAIILLTLQKAGQ